MTYNPRLTDQDIYRLAKEGFLHELGKLVEITRSSNFRELLPAFLIYRAFLATVRTRYFGEGAVEVLLKEPRLIDATDSSNAARKLFLCANLATCCKIFCGWSIPINGLESTRTSEYPAMALARIP